MSQFREINSNRSDIRLLIVPSRDSFDMHFHTRFADEKFSHYRKALLPRLLFTCKVIIDEGERVSYVVRSKKLGFPFVERQLEIIYCCFAHK